MQRVSTTGQQRATLLPVKCLGRDLRRSPPWALNLEGLDPASIRETAGCSARLGGTDLQAGISAGGCHVDGDWFRKIMVSRWTGMGSRREGTDHGGKPENGR